MSYTNKTTNYELPQWIGTDKPTFLEDMNGAYQAIDTAMKENAQAAAAAQSTADTNTGSISTLDTQVNGVGGIASQISDIGGDITTLTGNVNTINSLIGDGTPTTTAQTLIGAINELESGKAASSDVTALQTKVGTAALTTTAPDLSGAVNELKAAIPANAMQYTGSHNIDVTSNGVKTAKQVMTDLYNAFIAYIGTKAASYRFSIVSISVWGATDGYSGFYNMPTMMYDKSFTSNTAYTYTDLDSSNATIVKLQLRSDTNHRFYVGTLGTTPAFSISDIGAEVPADGKTFRLTIVEYTV